MPPSTESVAFLRFILDTYCMWKFFLIFILYSCSQLSPKEIHHDDMGAAVYDHLRSSYLRGCVDAYKSLKVPLAFETCLDKAIHHEREVREIMDQDG